MEQFFSAIIGGTVVVAVNAYFNKQHEIAKENNNRLNLLREEISNFCGYCAAIKNSRGLESIKSDAKRNCEASIAMLKLLLVEEGEDKQNKITNHASNLMLKADEYSNRFKEDHSGDYLSKYYEIESAMMDELSTILFRRSTKKNYILKKLKSYLLTTGKR